MIFPTLALLAVAALQQPAPIPAIASGHPLSLAEFLDCDYVSPMQGGHAYNCTIRSGHTLDEVVNKYDKLLVQSTEREALNTARQEELKAEALKLVKVAKTAVNALVTKQKELDRMNALLDKIHQGLLDQQKIMSK